jgi:hypothetical protein
MWRVLRPGGLLTLSTEHRVSGPGPGLPGILMFDAGELAALIDADGWEPLDALDLAVSPATRSGLIAFAKAADEVRRHVKKNDGDLLFHKLDWSRYPHILLEHEGLVWTSVHLALRKTRR